MRYCVVSFRILFGVPWQCDFEANTVKILYHLLHHSLYMYLHMYSYWNLRLLISVLVSSLISTSSSAWIPIEIFAQYDILQELAILTSASTGTPITLDHEVIFCRATEKYIEILKMDEWSGISTMWSESVFNSTTGQRKQEFFNYSKKHVLKDCTLPINNKKVTKI